MTKKIVIGGALIFVTSAASPAHAVLMNNSQAQTTQTATVELKDRIIIKMHDSATSSGVSIMSSTADVETSMSTRANRKMKRLRSMYDGAHVMKLDEAVSDAELTEIIQSLESDPRVNYATIDRVMKPMFVPNDQYYSFQWHYYESLGGLNLPDAWDLSTGVGVVVAVLDTGIVSHSDLNANIIGGYDMISDSSIGSDGNGRDSDPTDPGDFCNGSSSSWHGTHVAGTIAAVTNNGTGVAGVAFNADVLAVRVLGTCGGYTSDIADGMVWAAGGNVSGVPNNPYPAQVLNLSLGGSGSCDNVSQAAINQARALGATIVVAAGNSAINVSNASPANCSGVISVGATNRSGGRASYSNFGSLVDVSAPGGESSFDAYDGVLSTLNSGTTTPGSQNYNFYQGTSMAAPHVAGAAALMYSLDPNITPTEVESILKSTARSFPSGCSQCGDGIVDAAAALDVVLGGSGVVTPTPTPIETPEPISGGGEISEDNLNGNSRSWKYYTVDVPAGASSILATINGGSGDADLYVRYGAAPTTRNYDCRPWLSGNSENCEFDNPVSGTWHIGIYGYSAYSGLSIDVVVE